MLYYIAENMELRATELAQRICTMSGQPVEEAEEEVKMAIQRVFHWAAYADKYGGTVQVRNARLHILQPNLFQKLPTRRIVLVKRRTLAGSEDNVVFMNDTKQFFNRKLAKRFAFSRCFSQLKFSFSTLP